GWSGSMLGETPVRAVSNGAAGTGWIVPDRRALCGRRVRVGRCSAAESRWPWKGCSRQPVTVIDPAIESHYGTGYERSRLFRDGGRAWESVGAVGWLVRWLPAPPARLLEAGGGRASYAAPLARRGYLVHLVDPVVLHVEQARQAAGSKPAAAFTAAVGDARALSHPDESQDAVVLFGPLYHLTEAAHRRQAPGEGRRV